MPHKLPFKIFSGEKSEYLAQKICESLDCELGKKVKTTFSDGEFAVYYDETVRGCMARIFLKMASSFLGAGQAAQHGMRFWEGCYTYS